MKRVMCTVLSTVVCFALVSAQPAVEKVDTAAIAKIKDEGFNRSKVMELASYLTDVYGPRLTWSPEYRRGADWVSGKLKEFGLENITYDYWKPVGKGWTLKKFSANVIAPVPYPVIAYPKAWSPGTRGAVKGNVVYLKATTTEDLAAYKGKLKGAFVLLSDPRDVRAHWAPEGARLTDSALLAMANAGSTAGMMGRMMRDSTAMQRFMKAAQFTAAKLEFCMKEGAVALIDAGRGDGGTLFSGGATVPRKVESIQDMMSPAVAPYNPDAPDILPQVTFAAEHYNRMIRMMEKGEKVQIEMNLEVGWAKPDSGFNIIAEIPGTDLKDEVVMIGAHFDTWHPGTGATDNSSGTAVCLEAVRILKALGLQPRRTIRIGLWGGEEQGLYGSREYVGQYLAERQSNDMMALMMGGGGGMTKKDGYDKFYVYFNNDNGTGKVRGVYLQGNDGARPIFRKWLDAAGDPAAKTLTIENTSGTDHLSFAGVGLPGFQFIQDPIEYETRTHHSNMDLYDRLQPDDLKQGAVFMAMFAYNASMRDGAFPRIAPPAPRQRPGGN